MNQIASITSFFVGLPAAVQASILTLLTTLVLYLFQKKVRLIYGKASNAFHEVKAEDDKSITVYTEKIFIQNTGRKQAEKIEICLSKNPGEMTIYPPRHFSKEKTPSGNCVIKLDYIPPREIIIIDFMHISELAAEVLSVQCTEGSAKSVNFWIQRRYPNWLGVLVLVLMFFGMVFIVEVAIKVAGHY